MSEIFEAIMVVSFGLSWPMSINKSIKSKSTKGKSLIFLIFIFFGYLCGIISKLIGSNITYVLAFYILNFLMVGIDLGIYFRNKKIEARVEK